MNDLIGKILGSKVKEDAKKKEEAKEKEKKKKHKTRYDFSDDEKTLGGIASQLKSDLSKKNS